eukprot:scaffold16468_cov38-Phaeocystis_antarctica.AAC.2
MRSKAAKLAAMGRHQRAATAASWHPSGEGALLGPSRAALSKRAGLWGGECRMSTWLRARPRWPCWWAKERRAPGCQARPADGSAA